MGVYIKGMIMPKSCDYCRFCLEEDVMFETEFKCNLTGKFINGDYEGNFPDDCPLVELPEKHGRLIDGDELFKQMNTAIAMMSGMMKMIGAEDDEGMQMELKAYRDIRDGIKDCDTVIEQESE